MIRYKIDVLHALKEKGYTTYRIRKEKIFGEKTTGRIRKQEPISWAALNRLCGILSCDIGDILEYTEDEEGKEEAE